MDRFEKSPPVIPPVQELCPRPVWSVMIPCYNANETIAATIKSVLAQSPGAETMQIEVVDDGSTQQGLEKLINDLGQGRIKYYRQPRNIGHVQTFNNCIARARGEYVHILHADDEVLPGYYEEMTKLFKDFPEAGVAFSSFYITNRNDNQLVLSNPIQEKRGLVPNIKDILSLRISTLYVVTTVRRSAYEEVGGFFGAMYSEDWLMWARLATKYSFAYVPQPLGKYYEYTSGSVSRASFADGTFVRDLKFVVNHVSNILPFPDSSERKEIIFKDGAIWLLNEVETYWNEKPDRAAALNQIKIISTLSDDEKVKQVINRLRLKITMPHVYRTIAVVKKAIRKLGVGNR